MAVNIKQVYRTNYAGENVITRLTKLGGQWNPDVEFIPNAVNNQHSTNQAVAIGNGTSRLALDLRHIANHRGGLLAENKLQSYGCNALYRDFAPDFLIATGDIITSDIVSSGYVSDHIVYANSDAVMKYPGNLYLIPQDLKYDAGSLAAYMAAFDGHKKVFLIGYDQYDILSPVNNVYVNTRGYPTSDQLDNGEALVYNLASVVSTYSQTEFIRVMPLDTYWIHPKFQPMPNFRQISYKDFVLEADLG
jgi:hypothetical protein